MKSFGRAAAVIASATLMTVGFAGAASATSTGTSDKIQLHIEGTKLHVKWIWTTPTTDFPDTPCDLNARVTFYKANGQQWKVYNDPADRSGTCTGNRQYYAPVWDTNWPNNTKVCATWYTLNGKRWGGRPCLTIHD